MKKLTIKNLEDIIKGKNSYLFSEKDRLATLESYNFLNDFAKKI